MSVKNKQLKNRKQTQASRYRWLGFGVWIVLSLHATTCLATTSVISQNYDTASTDKIISGSLVSLAANSSTTVEPASIDNVSRMIGVATASSLVELSSNGKNSLHVVANGSTQALVSDVNGDVDVGDMVTVSPIPGVGMKATVATKIIGIAQAKLSSAVTAQQKITDRGGNSTTVHIGLIPVSVSVEFYSVSARDNLSAFVPAISQDIANAISGKQVSPLRVLLATLILILGSVVTAVILATAIRNEIISIGRNPLAEYALRKSLLSVILAAVGTLCMTSLASYIVLVT